MIPTDPLLALAHPMDTTTLALLAGLAVLTLTTLLLGWRLKRARSQVEEAGAQVHREEELVQALLDGNDGTGQGVILAEGRPPSPTLVNLAATEFTGRSHRELLELESIWDLFPAPAQERLSALLSGQRLAVDRDRTFETQLTVPGDHAPFVQVTPVPLATDRILLVLDPEATRTRAQAAVEEATEHWTRLVESLPTLVYEVDLEGQVRFANHPLPGTSGAPPEGHRFVELFPTSQQPRLRGALQRAVNHGEVRSFTVTGPETKTGTPTYQVQTSPLRAGGQIVGVTVACQDVSQRARTDAEARRAKALLKATLDSLPRAIAILDDEAHILAANEAWKEGRVGRLPGATQHAVAEDYLEILDRVSNGQGPLADVAQGIREVQEGRLQRFIHEYEVESETRWVQVRISPLEGSSGGVVVSLEDITERRRAEADRRRASEQFEVAVGQLARNVGQAPDAEQVAQRLADAALSVSQAHGAAVVGPEGVIVVRGRDEAACSRIKRLLNEAPSQLDWFQASLPDAANPVNLLLLPEHRRLDEDETKKVEILATQAALALQRAEVLHRVRQAHDDLDRSLRQKQVFMDVLSHDLKNPLAVARGRLELLSMKHPEALEDLSTVEESLQRAEDLIAKAVFYSRLEEQEAIELGERDLVQLTWEVIDALEPLAEDQGLTIQVQAPNFLIHPAHPMLARALENLISNALKWSPSGGTVEIALDQGEQAVRLSVADHGPGIPEEDRRKLFSRFSRVDRAGVKGTGLGLAIAKRIVEMHDGDIRAEETPGGGSTFVIELPYDRPGPAEEHADHGVFVGNGAPAGPPEDPGEQAST